MDEIIEKYTNSIIKRLDKENMQKIIKFLQDNHCDYIEDILTDYLDLFTIDYEEFIKKYRILNQKYQNSFLLLASEDMNLLEEFFSNN